MNRYAKEEQVKQYINKINLRLQQGHITVHEFMTCVEQHNYNIITNSVDEILNETNDTKAFKKLFSRYEISEDAPITLQIVFRDYLRSNFELGEAITLLKEFGDSPKEIIYNLIDCDFFKGLSF